MVEFELPGILLAIPPVALLVAWLARDRELPPLRRFASCLAHALGFSLLLAAAAAPYRFEPEPRPLDVSFALDVSESVPSDALETAMATIERESTKLALRGHRTSLILFAGKARVERMPRAEPIAFDPPLRNLVLSRDPALQPSYTRVAPAADMARVLAENPERRHTFLFTDGHAPDVARALTDPRLTLVPQQSDRPEVALLSVQAPTVAQEGEPFPLHVDLRSTSAVEATLRIAVDGSPLSDLEPRVSLRPGRQTVTIERFPGKEPLEPGRRRIEVMVETKQDQAHDNNLGVAFLTVRGKPRVLLLREPDADDRAVRRFLEAHDYFVLAAEPRAALPEDLQTFDTILLLERMEGISAESVARLADYVNEGGGLFWCGGPGARSVPSPLADLLPVSIESPSSPAEPAPAVRPVKKKVLSPPVALLLAIDRSGSMLGENLDMARAACLAAVRTLSPHDRVGVIVFDTVPHWILRTVPAGQASDLEERLARVKAGGGTDIAPALREAERELEALSLPIRHVILLSDGITVPGDMDRIAARMASKGITVTTVTLLEKSFNLVLMRRIAELGRGRYFWASSPQALPQIFTRATREILPKEPETEPPPPDPPPPPPAETAFRLERVEAHEALRGIDISQAPPLRRKLSAHARPEASAVLVSSSDRQPLLAWMRRGAGKTAAWTSSFEPSWAGEFLRWPEAGRLLVQWSRFLSMPRESSLLQKVRLAVEPGKGRILIDAPDAAARLLAPEARSVPLGIDDLGRRRGEFELPSGSPVPIEVASGGRTEILTALSASPERTAIGLREGVFRAPPDFHLADPPPGVARNELGAWPAVCAIFLLTLALFLRRL